jgi:putative isomerase
VTEYARLQKNLASGWNTWNTRSVLAHVLLPQGFSVCLGFKESRDLAYLREALVGRPRQDEEQVVPGPRSPDGYYTELTIHWHGLSARVRSAVEDGELLVLVTPLEGQLAPARLVVECGVLWNRDGFVRRRNGIVEGVFPGKTVPVFVTAPPHPEFHVPATVPYYACLLTCEIGVCTGRSRSLEEIRSIVERHGAEIATRHAADGDLADLHDAMTSCLAWDTIYDPRGGRVITPVTRIWNDQGYKLFCWDTYFAAWMWSADSRALACANAVEITNAATADGFVPNFEWSGIVVSRDRSQPPVGSLVVLELFRTSGERWLLEEVFDKLFAWNRWWPGHRQVAPGALGWGSNPATPATGNYWETAGLHDRFGAALESGLDNSPLYDDVPFNKATHCLALADVGLTSLFVADCLALAESAGVLGRKAEAGALRDSAETFGAGLGKLWDGRAGIFKNFRTDLNAFSDRLSPTCFYPLLTPFVTAARAHRLVDEHLLNPAEFWGDWVLPSISRNDPAYPDQEYWRGRIWAPMNFLVYLGLRRQGLAGPRRLLAERSAALLRKEWSERGHVHENYNANTGEGCDVATSDRYYHWGGLLALAALMEAGRVEENWLAPRA